MTFIQIVSFHTDRLEEVQQLDHDWTVATRGRSTLVASASYADHDDPTHFVSINEFASYESSRVNSALPETSAMADAARRFATGPVSFLDLDLVTASDVRVDLAAALRHCLETSSVPDDLFTDDVALTMIVPFGRTAVSGPAQIERLAREETIGRTFDQWDCTSTSNGFVVEYAYRTRDADQPSTLAVGLMSASIASGRISRLHLTCGGNWDDDTERRLIAASGATVGAGVRS